MVQKLPSLKEPALNTVIHPAQHPNNVFDPLHNTHTTSATCGLHMMEVSKIGMFVVYVKWYVSGLQKVAGLWFTESGMNVVYKKWYVRGLQKVVCTWFTKNGMLVVYTKRY